MNDTVPAIAPNRNADGMKVAISSIASRNEISRLAICSEATRQSPRPATANGTVTYRKKRAMSSSLSLNVIASKMARRS